MDAETRPAWVVPERLALLLVLLALLVSLFSRALRWDWLMDTLFLALATVLVVRGSGVGQAQGAAAGAKRWPVLVCGYLFIDSVFLLLVSLRGSFLAAVYYLLLSVLYGLALRLRMQQLLPAEGSPWSLLFAPPYRVVSALSLVALACMFLPLTQVFNGFTAWSGPMVMYMPGTMHMDPGHTVRIGGMVWVYGYQIALGHPVCLLLIGIALLPGLRAAGLIRAERGVRVLQWSTVAIPLWWMLFARGFQSLLRYPATLVFVLAVIALTVMLFRGRASASSQEVFHQM